MGISSLSQIAVLGGLAIAFSSLSSSLPAGAIGLQQRPLSGDALGDTLKVPQPTQTGETLCRQTNAVTAIYQQPDPVSVSQGVLPAGQTVRLEVVGTGTGWSRIRDPIAGWVEARYLTPPTPCTVAFSSPSSQTSATVPPSANPASVAPINSAPIAARAPINTATPSSLPAAFPQPTLLPERSQVTVPPLSAAANQTYSSPQALPQPFAPASPRTNNLAVAPTVPPLPAILSPRPTSTGRAIVMTTCDVLPREGLMVRRQPDLTSAGISVLAPGTYNFQFTGATQTIGRERLAYIVAPAEGWIRVGTLDGDSTLGGGRCG